MQILARWVRVLDVVSGLKRRTFLKEEEIAKIESSDAVSEKLASRCAVLTRSFYARR